MNVWNSLFITIVSRIEILTGRFASVMKAADGIQLLRAQERMRVSESDDLSTIRFLKRGSSSTRRGQSGFDRLQRNRKLRARNHWPRRLPIAAIALANANACLSRVIWIRDSAAGGGATCGWRFWADLNGFDMVRQVAFG